jgi:hypothetical protein
MSLDLYINRSTKCPKCSEVISLEDEAFWRNITHNVNGMWRKAGVYEALYESEGKRSGDYLETLEAGLTDMLERFETYKAMDAPNGWGKAEHACAFLWAVIQAVRENPDGVFHVSR